MGKRSRKQLKYSKHTETTDSYESSYYTSLPLDRQNTSVLKLPAVPGNNKLDWRGHEDLEEFAICFFLFFFKVSKQSGLEKSEILCHFLTKS